MKRITITKELRQKISLKLQLYLEHKNYLNGAGNREFDLLTTYIKAGSIREDIYEELCGII